VCKCNVILKRLKSERKIMFVYSKLGHVCVCGDVLGVAKLSSANLVVSLHYSRMPGSLSCSVYTAFKISFRVCRHHIMT
jgi:hypothetical protein